MPHSEKHVYYFSFYLLHSTSTLEKPLMRCSISTLKEKKTEVVKILPLL